MSQSLSKSTKCLLATFAASLAIASAPSAASEPLDVTYLAPLHGRLQLAGTLDACNEEERHGMLIEEGMVRRAISVHHDDDGEQVQEEAVLQDSLFGSGFSNGVKIAIFSIRKWDTQEEIYPAICSHAVQQYEEQQQGLEDDLPAAPPAPKPLSEAERRALAVLANEASTPLVRASLLDLCGDEQAETAESLDAEAATRIAESKPDSVAPALWNGRARHFLAGYSAGQSFQFYQSMGEAACDMARE